MTKINIPFNGTNYLIDESVLDTAAAELQSHLQTSMSGSGAVINLGGNSYDIDSAKLTTQRNEFVSHLGTISGDGSQVTVNGVKYGVDSGKVSDAITELSTALDTLVATVPKRYTVTLAYNSGYKNDTFDEASWIPLEYSVDGGVTWNEWYVSSYDSSIEIPEVKTIMFRISNYGDSLKELLISKTLGTFDGTLSIEGTGTEASLNITENTTLYCTMLELCTAPHGGGAPG